MRKHVEYEDVIERIVTKAMLENEDYARKVCYVGESDYFDDYQLRAIFIAIKRHLSEFGKLPSKQMIVSSLPEDRRDVINTYIMDSISIDIDLDSQHEWLSTITDKHLKFRAKNKVILDYADEQDKGFEVGCLSERIAEVENLTIKDNRDVGFQLFGDGMEGWLDDCCSGDEDRLATGYPQLDEHFNGGMLQNSLTVIAAPTHTYKSNLMINMMARQVLEGKNVAFASMEMDTKEVGKRLTSIMTKSDLNRMFFNSKQLPQMRSRMAELNGSSTRGQIVIEKFPASCTSANDLEMWIKSILAKGINLDCVYIDYLGIMMSSGLGRKTEATYTELKLIVEEVRNLSLNKFNIPIIAAAQLNREGSKMRYDEVSINHIAESHAIAQTADALIILGKDEDISSEVYYKIVKSRFGPPVQQIQKLFLDERSLAMYCNSEESKWFDDGLLSGRRAA